MNLNDLLMERLSALVYMVWCKTWGVARRLVWSRGVAPKVKLVRLQERRDVYILVVGPSGSQGANVPNVPKRFWYKK